MGKASGWRGGEAEKPGSVRMDNWEAGNARQGKQGTGKGELGR